MATYKVVDAEKLDADMTSVADTIRTKGGTTEQLAWPDGYKAAIEAIQTGGGAPVEVEEKDVNFYDYDGTLLYSYTLAEAQALTELPPLPSRGGLICQEWNCTLEQIMTWKQPLDIGALYTTDDGKTRIYIQLVDSELLTIPLKFYQSVANGVEIDWGDNSAIETISGTGNVVIEHTYAKNGKYKISLNAKNGVLRFIKNLTGETGYIRSIVQKVEIGNNVDGIEANSFDALRQMQTITIPVSVTYVRSYAFQYCYSLRWIVLPPSFTQEAPYILYNCRSLLGVCLAKRNGNIPNRYLGECSALRRLTIKTGPTALVNSFAANCLSLNYVYIPETVNDLKDSAFSGCSSLTRVVFAGPVTAIAASVFSGCTSMVLYDFTKCTSVPTLSDTNSFKNIPSDCEIRVPAALYDEWIAATNWSTYAANIVGV